MKGNIFLFCSLFILSTVFHTVLIGNILAPHANRIIDLPKVEAQSRPSVKELKQKQKRKPKTKAISDNKAHSTSVNSVSEDTISVNSISGNSVSDNIYKNLKLGYIDEDIILEAEKVAPVSANVCSATKGDYKPGDYWFVCSPGRKGDIVVYSENMLYKLNIDGVRNFTDASVHLDENSFYYTDKNFKVKLATSLSESNRSPNLVAY